MMTNLLKEINKSSLNLCISAKCLLYRDKGILD